MSTQQPSFQLRFVKNLDNSDEDAAVCIKPGSYGEFSWTFDSPDSTKKEVATFGIKEAVEARLDTLLELIYLDSDPFQAVQLDAPGFPSVLFRTRKLARVRGAILRAFRQIAANWPTYSAPPPPPPARQERRVSLASTESYSSMPELVSTTNGYNRHWYFD
jgi:hypothetical protein